MPLTMEMALREAVEALRDRADRRERELDELEPVFGPHDESRSRIKAWRRSADALEGFALAREMPSDALGTIASVSAAACPKSGNAQRHTPLRK